MTRQHVMRGLYYALRPTAVATQALRRLPDYLIIGGQKCGTTSLAAHLRAHPQVVGLPGVRGAHFFDLSWTKGVGHYRSWFPLRATRPGALAGESTTYYLFHPLAAERAASTVPDARIIAILRNPIDRAYSHYRHNVRHGVEPLSFAEAIEREPRRLDGEHDRLLSGSTASPQHQRYSYIARGKYAGQLREWLRVFPRDQVLVLSSEEFLAQTNAQFASVTQFLALPQVTLSQYPRHNAGGDAAALSVGTRERLGARFADANQELYDLIGRDLGWQA